MNTGRKLLFNPGPTNVSEEVREALKTENICHREPEFREVLLRVNKRMIRLLHGEGTHSSVLFVCSGTGCNEAVINTIRGKVLLIHQGKYSERLREIMETYHIPYVLLKVDLAQSECTNVQQIMLQQIEELLKNEQEITHIYAVHHETTTGMLMPIHEIGQISHRYQKRFCIDAVSSLGGHALHLQEDGIDFCTVSANKCLESYPGVSFVIGRTEAIKETKDTAQSYYFNLYRQWEKGQQGEMPFTPAVQLIFALDKAMELFQKEGYDQRVKRYERLAAQMREGLQKLGFQLLLPPEELRSNILTSVQMPPDMDYWQIHDRLKKRGITIYSDDKVLDKGTFRIATLGNLTEQDVTYFLTTFKDVLDES